MSRPLNRYLVERRKENANDYYIVGVLEAPSIASLMIRYAGELCANDSLRVSLLSVSMVRVGRELFHLAGRE